MNLNKYGLSLEQRYRLNTLVKVLLLVKLALKQPRLLFPIADTGGMELVSKSLGIIAVVYCVLDFLIWHDAWKSYLFPLILLCMGWMMASVVVHHQVSDLSFTMAYYACLFLYVFGCVSQTYSSDLVYRQHTWMLWFLLAIDSFGTFICLYAFIAMSKGLPIAPTWNGTYVQSNPNVLSRTVLVFGALCFHLLFVCLKKRRYGLSACAAVGYVISWFDIVHFQSRGALVAYLAFAFLYLVGMVLLYIGKNYGRRILLAALGVCLVMGVCAFFVFLHFQKTLDPSKTHFAMSITNTNLRSGIWRDGVVLISQKPWFGWKSNVVNELPDTLIPSLKPYGSNLHNSFLQLALFCGVFPAVLLTGLFIFVFLYPVWLFLRDPSMQIRSLDFCLWTMHGMNLIQAMVEPSLRWHQNAVSYLFYMTLGYLLYRIALYRKARKNSQTS